jgi:general secretion pathway protein H
MQTSATGEGARRRSRLSGGFTLLELLVVVGLMALASAGVGLAMSSFDGRPLEQEAQRLAAHLDAARAQAYLQGEPVRWRPDAEGYWLGGQRHLWQNPGVVATRLGGEDSQDQPLGLSLPPEPIMAATRIALVLNDQRLELHTDGLGPFAWTNGAHTGKPTGQPPP